MKILNRVQDAIRRGDFAEARTVLDSQSETFPTTTITGRLGQSFEVDTDDNSDSNYSDLQKDYGSGRASRGLIFLELVSLSKRGKDLERTLLFDRIPQYANVKSMDLVNTNEDKINFIAVSLGAETLIAEQKIYTRSLYEGTETRFVNIFDQVKAGSFLRKNNDDILSYLRKSVRSLKIAKDRAIR